MSRSGLTRHTAEATGLTRREQEVMNLGQRFQVRSSRAWATPQRPAMKRFPGRPPHVADQRRGSVVDHVASVCRDLQEAWGMSGAPVLVAGIAGRGPSWTCSARSAGGGGRARWFPRGACGGPARGKRFALVWLKCSGLATSGRRPSPKSAKAVHPTTCGCRRSRVGCGHPGQQRRRPPPTCRHVRAEDRRYKQMSQTPYLG